MNNMSSPRTDDVGIQQQIQAKGKTAPRVTPDKLKEVIASTHFFSAAEGVIGAFAASEFQKGSDDVTLSAGSAHPDLLKTPLNLLTICVLVLRNGFTVIGESACASPENFDAEIGRNIAYGNAVNKIWPLEGYLLKERLYQSTLPAAVPA